MKRSDCTIDGRECSIFENGTTPTESCIFCGMDAVSPDDCDEITKTAEQLFSASKEQSWTLVIFKVTDWNRDFSPWCAPAVYGTEPFEGKAPELLQWLIGAVLPAMKLPSECKKYLAGYSLSGLFALWGLLESDIFDGVASCSGSLWFPDWMDYLKNHRPANAVSIYLSLGSKEEKTKNQAMAVIGDNTRSTYVLLKKQPNVKKITLEWNKGGHFANPTERLVKGMTWLLKNGGASDERT